MITGYCFFRDNPTPAKIKKEKPGLKKVVFIGVAYVPEEMETNDTTYSMNGKMSLDEIAQHCFGSGDGETKTISMLLENPQKPKRICAGWTLEDILLEGAFLPNKG